MPELPEVEVVKRELEVRLPAQEQIMSIEFSKFNLRSPLPRAHQKHFINQRIVSVSRRSKYLLFYFSTGDGFLSHLGMTGNWRFEAPGQGVRKHDHIKIGFENCDLIYNDPRRFGFFELMKKNETHSLLKKLGPEPLSDNFHEPTFLENLRTKSSPIKNVIMNAEVVVGVGNIYACESLFRAGISPMKKANRLSSQEVQILRREMRQVLLEAIALGGSSIDDYRQVSGKSGDFQKSFFVYGRESEPCLRCQTKIKKRVLAGRSTFWCPKCQSLKKIFGKKILASPLQDR